MSHPARRMHREFVPYGCTRRGLRRYRVATHRDALAYRDRDRPIESWRTDVRGGAVENVTFSKIGGDPPRQTARDREGERKTENEKRFVGGCDESKSGSHWTELRKSVDREDRREAEGGGGGGGGGGRGGGKGGGGDGGSTRRRC